MNNQYKYPVLPIFRPFLVISSCFFFIPAFLAFNYHLPILGTMSFLTGIASIIFWAGGQPDYRLVLDKLAAYSTLVSYCWIGFMDQNIFIHPWIIAVYIAILIMLRLTYKMSCYRWNNGKPDWVIYHIGFHISLTVGEIIVIFTVKKTCRPSEYIS